jgi:TatD DNase family protein
MTDAHCHVSCGDPSVRELLVGRDFFGVHPWEALEEFKAESLKLKVDEELRALLIANPKAGVGEIGLDRLKCRDIPPLMREVFEAQLSLAFELRRPVVLHGAKCWGQVVRTCEKALEERHLRRPAAGSRLSGDAASELPLRFLFHGFSRSDGLIPDIVRLGGFISVGPAVLNDHAVNYRELVKKIPMDRLLVETDRTDGTGVSIYDVLAKTAELRGISAAELERITDANADAFMGKMV